ncbi:MAG: 2Fe-2S iron-sulfur cluster-binding protein [Ramlibacter sp.]|nr:2Fe-2S iron-sulfur cluster-binding protein [Ramlibacter sp.]
MSNRTTVQFVVNGASLEASVEPRTSLADLLRDKFQLTGTHVACEQGVCGACTVIVDGKPVRSCITWAASLGGAEVRTIEGFETDPTMQRLREAFSREHGLQCGFCTPGMLVTARDIALRLPGCDENRVRHELGGNLCRCTGYAGIVRAVCSVVSPDGGRLAEQRPALPPFQAFEPVADAGSAQAPVVPAAHATAESGAQITETIVVRGCDAQRLWELVSDVGVAVTCLPGARVDRFDGQHIAGAVKVSFGPVKAEFVGEGTVVRDEAARRAVIRGTATDPRSRTLAKADISYRAESEPGASGAARLVIGLDYDVQGPLAQFSRSDLVRSLVGQLVRDFGRNLEALAAGNSPRASNGFSALGLLGRWLLARIRGLFRPGRH